MLDADGTNNSILCSIDGNSSIYIDKFNNVGINTTSPFAQLDIKSSDGMCIRLGRDEAIYTDMSISPTGDFIITPSGSTIVLNNSLDIQIHNGSSVGLFLNGTLVTSTANQLNYINTPIGVAAPSKAMILDESKSIIDINKITLSTPLAETSGGTGTSIYNVGDILIADTSTTLTRLPLSTAHGCVLLRDELSATGVSWKSGLLEKGLIMKYPIWINLYLYSIPYCYARSFDDMSSIIIKNATTIDISKANQLNGFITDIPLTGNTILYPDSTTITGVNTQFLTQLAIGDIITIGNSSRRISTITNNTSCIVETVFDLYNTWTLTLATLSTANFKFGIRSFLCTSDVTAKASLRIGRSLPIIANTWTLEFFLYPDNVSKDRQYVSSDVPNLFSVYAIRGALTLLLGNGIIANAFTTGHTLVANAWQHIAIVFTGAQYLIFRNGILGTPISTISNVQFNILWFGGNNVMAANVSYIDEIRLSNIARYTAVFTPTNVPFIKDVNTVALQHFEISPNISHGDDTISLTQMPIYKGGLAQVNYLYAIDNETNNGYIMSYKKTESMVLTSTMPSGFAQCYIRRLPFYVILNSQNIPYSLTSMNNGYFQFGNNIPIIINSMSTILTEYSLNSYLPYDAYSARLLVCYDNTTRDLYGLWIGLDEHRGNTIMSNITNSAEREIDVSLSTVCSIYAFIPKVTTGVTFSIYLVGFYS